jgi:aminobenzoyl-glutamate utilization protein A
VNATSHLASGSEDATFFMRRVQERGGQALYAVVGSDISSGHHTPTFDIDEADMSGRSKHWRQGSSGLAKAPELPSLRQVSSPRMVIPETGSKIQLRDSSP